MKQGKPHIFFDFDGLKFNTVPTQTKYLNERWGVNLVPTDYPDGSYYEDTLNKYLADDKKVTREEVYDDLVENFLKSREWHEQILPMEGMQEVMNALAKKHTLWTVTARQWGGIEMIRYMLDKHIPSCITNIHCVWTNKDKVFTSVSKRNFIESIEGEKIGFIDDSPHEVQQIQDLIPSYLFDPKGIHDGNAKIINRVRSWEEIGKIFL